MARPTSVPSFPKPLPYALLVALATLLFGVAVVVTRSLFMAARAEPAPQVARPGVTATRGFAPPSFERDADGVRIVNSVGDLAHALVAHPQDIGGFRTLVTGSIDQVDLGPEAVDLARAMSEAGADVIVIDWSPEGNGLADRMGLEPRAGFNELLQGQATFEDVVTRVPGSGAHLIAAGNAVLDRDRLLDADQLNLTLDALDTAYDHILVVARKDVARALFGTILGRFDAGVMISEPRRRGSLPDIPGTFLGYEVADIELFRLERPKSNQLARERLARFTTRGGMEAQAS